MKKGLSFFKLVEGVDKSYFQLKTYSPEKAFPSSIAWSLIDFLCRHISQAFAVNLSTVLKQGGIIDQPFQQYNNILNLFQLPLMSFSPKNIITQHFGPLVVASFGTFCPLLIKIDPSKKKLYFFNPGKLFFNRPLCTPLLRIIFSWIS